MRRVFWLLDLAAVLLFVGIGLSVHAHGLRPAGVASTAWPFVVGLAVAWLGLALGHHTPVSIPSGGLVVVVTVAVGMTLRVVSGQGTALPFIFVALGFLGATLVGWRMLVVGVNRL